MTSGDGQPDHPQVMALGGYPILRTTEAAFAHALFQAQARGEQRQVFFANTNFVVQCQALRQCRPTWPRKAVCSCRVQT